MARADRRPTERALRPERRLFGVLFPAPALLGIAPAVKVTSRGSVSFRQRRVGRDGQTLSMLKYDSVRIDVRYVENWPLTFDFMILWKTVGAVLRGRGAY